MSEEKKKGPADGGKARWEGTTAKERSEAARKMAAARWTAGLPRATHEGELKIGDVAIPCAVVGDGDRVITQRGMAVALGRHVTGSGGKRLKDEDEDGVANLPSFLSAKNIKPFISNELSASLREPIEYVPMHGGRSAYGFRADLFPQICDVWLKAKDAGGVLTQGQMATADRAYLLIRALAHVAIVALVDEATGYQKDRARDALAKILEAFIAKELQPYVKTFDPDFYEEMCRLRKWPFDGSSKRPQFFGNLTNDLVYARLAPGILKELKEKNPAVNGRRKVKHFQYLTENHGHPKLTKHLGAVTALMSVSKTWEDFYKLLEKHKPKQIEYPLYDGLDQDGDAG